MLDYPLSIGRPPREHKFDLVSEDGGFVAECKNFSWTKSGNTPQAKVATLNEAVFFLTFLPASIRRFVVLRTDVHPNRNESLANYYHRTYQHLLQDVEVIEVDLNDGTAEEIG